jgi:hypothetical protein
MHARSRRILNRSGLEVVVVNNGSQVRRFDKMMGEEHYLRSSAPVGGFPRQVATRDGERVGLLGVGCVQLRIAGSR